ncbi:MAG: DUF401 family protein [Euryarchaeota archaeon]|nr:DUF401 family protein [Euryarchaeota archaeon]
MGFSIVAGALLLIAVTLPADEGVELAVFTASSEATLTLMLIIYSVLLLSYTMESAGMLSGLTSSLAALGGRLILVTIPLLIGLLPMPAGALVSAMMLSGMIKEQRLSPETATFANYWFRHLWIPTWPLYPAFIITMGVVELDALKLARINLPLTLAAVVSGLLLLRRELRAPSSSTRDPGTLLSLLKSAWPIAAIILLALVAGVELSAAILLVLLTTLLLTRPPPAKLRQIARKALDPRMGVLIYGVILFRNAIEASGAAAGVMEHLSGLGLPVVLVAMAVSFLVGFAVGIEMAPPSIALPLFISLIGRGSDVAGDQLLLIFTAGYLGVQLSPMHLCLTVSASYFKASISRVYRRVALACALSLGLVLVAELLIY